MADNATTFSIDLAVKAEGVKSAADLLDVYAQRLDGASQAATEASEAVKASSAAYKSAETTYDRASKALEKINVAMESASGKKLENLIARQGEASKAVLSAKGALEQEAIALDRMKASAAAADQKVDHLSKTQAAAKKSIDEQKKAQEKAFAANELLASSLGSIGGPLGVVGQKAFALKGAWDKMGKALGSAGPYLAVASGVAAIAVSVALVTAAVIAGVAHITAWAVGLADVARTNTLLAAGMVQSASGGEELSAVIDDITKAVPQTREQISSMAAELAKTGLRGEALYKTLQANAETAAKLKFGPEWEDQMLSLDQQQKRLHAGLTGLFSGLHIEGLLSALSVLVDTLDESSASGRAVKVVFETLFQPIVDGATGLVPVVRHAFLQFEILALKALIAIKPWGSAIVKVGEVLAVVAAVVLGAFAVAIGAAVFFVGAFAAALALPIVLFYELVRGAIYVAGAIANIGTAITGALANFSLVDMGANLIAGLAAGITSGATAVVDAVTGAATGAIDAAKKALGIASPSKVFAEIGAYTGEGMTQGIRASSGSVEAAMTDLATPPTAQAGASAAPSSSSGSTYQITINAGAGAEDIAEKLRQVILDITEGAAIQLGAAVPA